MPLVRLSLTAGRVATHARAISGAVHDAMVETIAIPAADRFQIITEHTPENIVYDREFLGVERSDEQVIVQIALRRGRSTEVKQALYRAIVDKIAAAAQVRVQDVIITLVENDSADWSFGNGEAQFVK
jgi:4-oxalocrotonate tautomerase